MSILCTYTPSLSFSPPPLAPIIFFYLLSLVFINTTQFLQVDYCMRTCRVTCSPGTRIHV